MVSGRSNRVLVDSVVIVLPAHFRIVRDPLLPRLATNDGPAHGTRDQGSKSDQNGGSQYEVRAEGHVRYEKEYIDQKRQDAENEIEDADEEYCEQIPGGM